VSNWMVTILGILAACGTTGSWVPQAWKTIRTRRAEDFSWGYLVLFTSGVVLWAIYGVLRQDIAVFGANCVAFGFLVPIIIVKAHSKPTLPSA